MLCSLKCQLQSPTGILTVNLLCNQTAFIGQLTFYQNSDTIVLTMFVFNQVLPKNVQMSEMVKLLHFLNYHSLHAKC
jgi:hypothetical protein